MVRLYDPKADLLPGVRDPFTFRIPDPPENESLLEAIGRDFWTTLGYERGGCGSGFSLRRCMIHADRAVWSFYERLTAEAEKGVKVR